MIFTLDDALSDAQCTTNNFHDKYNCWSNSIDNQHNINEKVQSKLSNYIHDLRYIHQLHSILDVEISKVNSFLGKKCQISQNSGSSSGSSSNISNINDDERNNNCNSHHSMTMTNQSLEYLVSNSIKMLPLRINIQDILSISHTNNTNNTNSNNTSTNTNTMSTLPVSSVSRKQLGKDIQRDTIVVNSVKHIGK